MNNFKVLAGALLIAALLCVPVMAQGVSIPITGKTLQTISIASTGTASGLSLPVGVTITDTVLLQRSHNVPISLSIRDAMEGTPAKDATLAGKMAYWFVSGSQYNPVGDSAVLATKTGFALGTGAYVTTSATAAPLATGLAAGEITEVLHIKNTVIFSDKVILPASPDYLKLTVIIDAVPA